MYVCMYIFICYIDTRSIKDYNDGHIQLAKLAKKATNDNNGAEYRVPFGAHLPTCLHCVVYDSNTVSVIEDSKWLRCPHFNDTQYTTYF